jgi:hypothetical protein
LRRLGSQIHRPRPPGSLNAAIDHVPGQPRQDLAAAAERRKPSARALFQVARPCLGDFESEHARVGGFGARRIGADGLAEIFGVALDVEDVVLNLKRKSDVLRVAVELASSASVLIRRE